MSFIQKLSTVKRVVGNVFAGRPTGAGQPVAGGASAAGGPTGAAQARDRLSLSGGASKDKSGLGLQSAGKQVVDKLVDTAAQISLAGGEAARGLENMNRDQLTLMRNQVADGLSHGDFNSPAMRGLANARLGAIEDRLDSLSEH